MRKFLIDPNLKWYKANLHCHTVLSDGYFTPEEVKKHYMDHGYNIVAFTDHEAIFDNSYLTDENFVALTGTEYSINLPSENGFRDIITMHMCLYSKDPHNIFHPGADISTFREYQIKYYKEKLNMEIPCDGYKRKYTQESIQEVIDRANASGFLVQLNHPNWSLNVREDYINLKGLWALEIYNYLTDIETGAEYCPNIYDDMLRHGHKIFATMNDDNHNYLHNFTGSFGGFNYIGVESLTYENVFNALKTGNFYSSMGPTIELMFYDTEKKSVYLICSPAVDVVLIGYNRTFRPLVGEDLTEAYFPLNGSEKYFRIAIKDKYGRWACTNPYYLEDLE